MDFSPSDIIFLVVVLWIVIEIMNNGDWGSGRRVRNQELVALPAACGA